MADSNDQNMLDLGALAPKPAKLKLPSGIEIDVQQPTLEQSLRLAALGQQLQNAGDAHSNELSAVVNSILYEIKQFIPELEGITLSAPQLFGLIQFVSKMALPADSKALQEAGISLDVDPKKAE